MELGERLDQLHADPAALLDRLELGRRLLADDNSVDAFHQIERSANNARVLAGNNGPRDTRGRTLERRHGSVFAQDVVGGRKEIPAGRAAQDPALVASRDVKGLVRISGL